MATGTIGLPLFATVGPPWIGIGVFVPVGTADDMGKGVGVLVSTGCGVYVPTVFIPS
jgi:hypothetical protein